MSVVKRSLKTRLSIDQALGVAGGSLAAASLGFGVYMNIHGPAASFGKSHDFTVFAQLAAPRPLRHIEGMPAAAPRPGEDLDFTATASIRKTEDGARSTVSRPDDRMSSGIIASARVETADEDKASILLDGRPLTVHVGDRLPDVGEVLEIMPGARPLVRTTKGLILATGSR